jgi:alkylhydroperoxidase family enzyme
MLKTNYTDQEIAEITVQNAIANYHNFVNIPMNLQSEGLEEFALEKAG